jgi:hypothetical protein
MGFRVTRLEFVDLFFAFEIYSLMFWVPSLEFEIWGLDFLVVDLGFIV